MKVSCESEELSKLRRKVSAKLLDCSLHLFLLYFGVLFSKSSHSQSLPGQRASQKVDKDIGQSLKVVSSGLLNSQVSIDGGISGCTCESFSILIRNVFLVWVHELFGQSKVKYKNSVLLSFVSDGKIVWLDVSVDDSPWVNVFNSFEHLNGTHESCLKRELLLAFLKKWLQRRSQQVHDHYVLSWLSAVELYLRNCLGYNWRLWMKPEIDLALQVELLVSDINVLKLNGHSLLVNEINGLPDLTEGSLAQLLNETVLFTDNLVLGYGSHYNYNFFIFIYWRLLNLDS